MSPWSASGPRNPGRGSLRASSHAPKKIFGRAGVYPVLSSGRGLEESRGGRGDALMTQTVGTTDLPTGGPSAVLGPPRARGPREKLARWARIGLVRAVATAIAYASLAAIPLRTVQSSGTLSLAMNCGPYCIAIHPSENIVLPGRRSVTVHWSELRGDRVVFYVLGPGGPGWGGLYRPNLPGPVLSSQVCYGENSTGTCQFVSAAGNYTLSIQAPVPGPSNCTAYAVDFALSYMEPLV
jgi:hypothetical protein